MSNETKSIILYHRSYRKITRSLRVFLLQFLVIALPFSLSMVFCYPQITHTVCIFAQAVLVPFFSPDALRVIKLPYVVGNVFLIDLPSKYPSIFFSLVNSLVCLFLLVLLPVIRSAKHVFIFLIAVCFINLISSLYFIFFPYHFPYEAVDYSELYIKQQVSIWFFVPIIMGLSILPLPSTLTSKMITMLVTFFYSLIFGTVRYVVFLFILANASLLYMAVLFFVLGPLVDFIYIVGIYSVHVTILSKKIRSDFTSWNWLY